MRRCTSSERTATTNKENLYNVTDQTQLGKSEDEMIDEGSKKAKVEDEVVGDASQHRRVLMSDGLTKSCDAQSFGNVIGRNKDLFDRLVSFLGMGDFKRLKCVDKRSNHCGVQHRQHFLEQAREKCSQAWKNIHVDGIDKVAKYLDARDFASLGCTNSCFYVYCKFLDSFWEREYQTNQLVREVFSGSRSDLDGTVPPGFTKRTFVIAQTSGRCFFCPRKVKEYIYQATPVCSDCSWSLGPDSPLLMTRKIALSSFYPRLQEKLVMSLPQWVYPFRRDKTQAYLFLDRDIRWMNASHPQQIAKRNAQLRKDAQCVLHEATMTQTDQSTSRILQPKENMHPRESASLSVS